MDDRNGSKPTDGASPDPRPRRFETVADMWLSDDPPWDPDVLENVEELSGHLEELRAWGDRGGLLAWCELR